MTTYVVVGLVGFATGILAGMFGVGGGILFVPTLAYGLGLSQLHAEATSLLAILPTAVAGAWRQHRYGNVRWTAALVIGATALAGVEVGIRVAEAIPEDDLRRLFGVLVLLVAAQLAWGARKREGT